MPSVTSTEHMSKSRNLRLLLAAYSKSEDLIRIGAYQKGFDAVLDKAVEVLPELNGFLQQGAAEAPTFAAVVQQLTKLPS